MFLHLYLFKIPKFKLWIYDGYQWFRSKYLINHSRMEDDEQRWTTTMDNILCAFLPFEFLNATQGYDYFMNRIISIRSSLCRQLKGLMDLVDLKHTFTLPKMCAYAWFVIFPCVSFFLFLARFLYKYVHSFTCDLIENGLKAF